MITCACCDTPLAFELSAPVEALVANLATAQTRACPCGASLSVAFSWRQRRVVALRRKPPLQLQREHY